MAYDAHRTTADIEEFTAVLLLVMCENTVDFYAGARANYLPTSSCGVRFFSSVSHRRLRNDSI